MLKKLLLMISFVFVFQLVIADVPNEIRYNGKLKEYRAEVNATKSMNFKIYNQLTGGTAKWESGTMSVVVSSGIFSVVLNPDIDWRGKDYYLEIEIDSKKLEPREKLTAMPYALHSNTTESAMVKEDAEFAVTVGNDKKFAVDSAGAKTIIGNTEYFMVPKGGIIIWSGSVNNIPEGWVLCDGNNGTPDLRDRFVLGAGHNYAVDSTGGESEHILTIEEMPSHSHKYTTPLKGRDNSGIDSGNHYDGETFMHPLIDGEKTESVGGSQPHNNMPPYYALCYIMRK
jgi:microcystin-dependent protein